ncbi:MAG: putative metal-binding motif-containing protein [Deltaproteobacteria bacterium]|nr:putative metal-binding motif-containing protein [Deltaproteobacteria bacterium]
MATTSRLGIALVAVVVGCSSASGDSIFDKNGGGGSGAGTGKGGGGGTVIIGGGNGGNGGDINPPCGQTDPGGDLDGDGYTVGDGDCNDCSVAMNPGAYDFSGNGVDEDCNGTPDDEPFGCDQGLPIEGNDAMDAAKSLGLCKFAQEGATGKDKTWGVLSARYVFADGATSSKMPDSLYSCTGKGGQGSPPNDLSHGLLPKFGSSVKTREGSSMLVLSSGVAREGVNGDSPGGAQMCTKSGTPSGFPTPSTAACPGQNIDDTPIANDPIAFEMVIRAPTNAKSIAYDFDFYTYEFPVYVCTQYNDFFVGLLYSIHPTVPQNKNVSFDAQKNPVSVNNGFLEVCKAQKAGGKTFGCAQGTGELNGTGFEDHAATGWLQTSAAITPGEEFTIRFAIWDMGDEVLDSTVLIDNFRFDVNEGQNQTVRPPPK